MTSLTMTSTPFAILLTDPWASSLNIILNHCHFAVFFHQFFVTISFHIIVLIFHNLEKMSDFLTAILFAL